MAAPELRGGSSSERRRDKKDASLSLVPIPELSPNTPDTANDKKEQKSSDPVRIVGFEKVKPYQGLEMATVVLSTDERMGRFKIGGHNYTILGLFIDDGTGEAPVTPTIQKIEEEIERVNKKKVAGATSIGGLNQQLNRLGYEIVNTQPYRETVKYLFRKKGKEGEYIPVATEAPRGDEPIKKTALPKKYVGPTYEWYEPSPVYYVRQRPEELSLFDASDVRPKKNSKSSSITSGTAIPMTKISGVPIISPEEIAKREAKYREKVKYGMVPVTDDHEFPHLPPAAPAEVHPNQIQKELLSRIPLASIVALYLKGELTTYDGLKTYVHEVANAHPALVGKNIAPTIPFASDVSMGISTYVLRLLRESQSPNAQLLPGEQEAVVKLAELQKKGIRFAESLSTAIQMVMFRLQRAANIREPQAQTNNQKF